MTAAWLWARADLRRRWRSWVVLGILAGISVGLACAGIAGARRTDRALPGYVRASHIPNAAVLANDPAYDAAQRSAVAHLPEVTAAYPFVVAFALEVGRPAGLESPLVPAAARDSWMAGVIVDGRMPDPHNADEIVVNENVRDRFGLDVGSTMTLVQHPPRPEQGLPPELMPVGSGRINQTMRVVGISKATDAEIDSTPSSAFYQKYQRDLVGVTNQFVDLRHGGADLLKFQAGVQKVVGHPVNVVDANELFGVRKINDISNIEQGGLLLFALAVVLGAGALVGQALVRSVTAGAADLPTWRAIGADRRIIVRALVLPTLVTAVVGALTAVVVAIALSSRFPIGVTRNFELDTGLHADWLVLGLGAAALVLAVIGASWVTAEIRIRRRAGERSRISAAARLATRIDLPPSLLIGSRLAVEPGRGRRAVPVRSALIGAIVGVLGVVGCLTFRSGLSDTVNDPARSGIVWDFEVASAGPPVSQSARHGVARDEAVAASVDALWARAVRMNGRSIPTFGTQAVKGTMDLVVIEGRAPEGRDELALAPTTMRALGVHVGDRVSAGGGAGRRMRVVGSAFLPATSHTEYDESAWMTRDALDSVLPPADQRGPEFTEDWVLIRFRPGADVAAARKRMSALVANGGETFAARAALPTAVASLKDLRALPFALAIFFALLGVATVAHALVTTVRRRRHDLAVLRAIGFTQRDARLAIAWQATLIALVGLVVGIPLGIVTGRLIWRQLAESFPVAYVPPLSLIALLLIVPLAIVVANLIAAGPAHAATRIRPARVLRTE